MEEINYMLQSLVRFLANVNTKEYEISYRGLANIGYDNKPSLFRKQKRLDYEKLSVEEFAINFPTEYSTMRTIDILTQLQHYECPTRMLDVTSNFLVALFFACGGWDRIHNANEYQKLLNEDGSVRIYKVKKTEVKSVDSETVNLISNIARLKNGDDFGKLMWLCERDWGVWQTDDDLLLKNAEDVNSVFFVKTKLNNPRVRAQYGKFFLFGGLSDIDGHTCVQCLKSQKITKSIIEMPQDYIIGDICLPKDYKINILNDLESYFGISYATICPEKSDIVKTIMNND